MSPTKPLLEINNSTFEVFLMAAQSSQCEELVKNVKFLLLISNMFNIGGQSFDAKNNADD
jgi:hypothetical protein